MRKIKLKPGSKIGLDYRNLDQTSSGYFDLIMEFKHEGCDMLKLDYQAGGVGPVYVKKEDVE